MKTVTFLVVIVVALCGCDSVVRRSIVVSLPTGYQQQPASLQVRTTDLAKAITSITAIAMSNQFSQAVVPAQEKTRGVIARFHMENDPKTLARESSISIDVIADPTNDVLRIEFRQFPDFFATLPLRQTYNAIESSLQDQFGKDAVEKSPNKPSHHTVDSREDASANGW